MNSWKTIKELVQALTSRQRVIMFMLITLTAALGISLPFIVNVIGGYSEIVSREYIAGELSDEDVIANEDFSFVDEIATEEARAAANRSVIPVFRYSLSSTTNQRERLSSLVSGLRAGTLGKEWDALSQAFSGKDQLEMAYISEIADEALGVLLQEGIFSSESLSTIRAQGKTRVLVGSSSLGFTHEGLVRYITDLVTKEGVEDWVLDWVAECFPDLSAGDALLVAKLISSSAEVNVEFDPITTSAAVYDAEQSVPSVVIEVKQGEYILRRDSVVTDKDIRILQRIEEEASVTTPWRELAGHLVFTICIVIVLVLFLCSSIRYSYRRFQYICIILSGVILTELINFLISLKLSYGGVRYTDPYLPVIFVPVMAMFITGRRRIGLAVGLLFAGLAIMYPASSTFTAFYVVLISVAAVFTRRQGNQRIDLIYHALAAIASVAVITLLMAVFNVQPAEVVFRSVLIAVANCTLSFVLVMVFLPVLERVFNIPTTYRLYELAHTDSPALTRLSLVASGTFNHSKNVSEMAYYACKAIGANAELARVAGLYHDIGKAEHPEYFIENQNGKNAHDDLNKTLSAAVIKSHVRLGVEKAKDAGLPQEVIDIIGEHHGNDIIKYFYNAAVREGKEKNQTVAEEDFRYNGTIPQTPESGVVMLADCAEAATRTLKNPNHQKYEKFINSIILDKINYSQLTSSQLTLNDLNLVKEAFVRYLMGRDHHRIEYT